MSAACLLVAGKPFMLAAATFTLSWTHSVEKTGWEETWQIADGRLVAVEARVRGSGAGMDPGNGARLEDGWWTWTPGLAPQERIVLAASGETGGGWRLCSGDACLELGRDAGAPVTVMPCG